MAEILPRLGATVNGNEQTWHRVIILTLLIFQLSSGAVRGRIIVISLISMCARLNTELHAVLSKVSLMPRLEAHASGRGAFIGPAGGAGLCLATRGGSLR